MKFRNALPIIPLTEKAGRNREIEVKDSLTFTFEELGINVSEGIMGLPLISLTDAVITKLEDEYPDLLDKADFIGLSMLAIYEGSLEITIDLVEIKGED